MYAANATSCSHIFFVCGGGIQPMSVEVLLSLLIFLERVVIALPTFFRKQHEILQKKDHTCRSNHKGRLYSFSFPTSFHPSSLDLLKWCRGNQDSSTWIVDPGSCWMCCSWRKNALSGLAGKPDRSEEGEPSSVDDEISGSTGETGETGGFDFLSRLLGRPTCFGGLGRAD